MTLKARLDAIAARPPHFVMWLMVGFMAVFALGVFLAARPSRAGDQDRLHLIAESAAGRSWTTALAALRGRMDPAMLHVAYRYDPAPAPLSGLGVSSSVGAAEPAVARAFSNVAPDEALRLNAAMPFIGEASAPARPFVLSGRAPGDRERAIHCLTEAVYYEAGFESRAGRQAVAQVVLNRLRHPAYPKTVCGVVFQGSNLPTGCQFTFTCDGSRAHAPAALAWREAEQVAVEALDGYVMASVGNATHYHTQWVFPYWAPELLKVKQIGAHIFYRWAGGWGLPAAFRLTYAGGEPAVADQKSGFILATADVKGVPDAPPALERDVEIVSSADAAEGAGAKADEFVIALNTPLAAAVPHLAPTATLSAAATEASRRPSRMAVPTGW